MVNYIIRRLIYSVFLVFLVSIVVFVLMRMLPGDPVMDMVEQQIAEMVQAGHAPDLEMQQFLRNQLMTYHGLDRPVSVQFAHWLGDVIRLDFGRSMVRGFDIVDEVGRRMVVSIYLAIISMVVTLIFGILFGTIAAVRNGKLIDNVITSISNFGMTVPGFMIAILLIWVFGFLLDLLPIFGFQLPWMGDPGRSVRQTILPVLTMSLGGIAGLARMTRSAMLDVLNADYVRTAWAKGMREKAVIFKHVLKNGLMPIVSGVGGMIRGLFGGSVIVESIFVVPGVGQLLVMSMLSLDYPVIQAVTLLMAFITVISNLITDILYGWVDPRIQYS
ncbi:MAG: ABC transporter permease [Oscillospiraceae bacterium]|nr:ABC transporter permease [Oscillospiraceae bacterium]